MRLALRLWPWFVVLFGSLHGQAAEPVWLPDGGYQFHSDLYDAIVDRHGRLASLRVNGQELLSPGSVNAKVYGASLVAGPEHRTPLDLSRMTIESGMMVARGDGREVSYRFRPDGIDFLFDLPDQVHWVLHLNRAAITHLARPDGQVAPLVDGGPMAAARALEKAAFRVDPPLYVHIPWVGAPGAADMVVAGYCNVGPGKAEAHLNVSRHSGWVHQVQVVSIKPSCPDHIFPRGQPVRFDFELKNHHDRPFEGQLVFAVEDHAGFAHPQRFDVPVKLGAQTAATLTWQYQPDSPLVGKTLVELRSGEETVTSRDMVFVYDAENYRPPLTRPDDFAAFWQATMADMRARPLDLKVTPAPELSNAHKTVSQVSFTGLGGRTIDGWLEEPAAPGKYVASFGARVQNYQWPKPGPNDTTDTVSLVMKLYRDGLYGSGMESRETAEFRHVYADHARCVDVLLTRDGVDPKRIVALGASRTGPSALAAAALDPRIALVDIHVPTSAGISWPTRFYGGWGAHGSSARPPDVSLDEWLRRLAYFDMVNFAPDVKCPAIIGLGLRDYGLSPAPGIIAAYAYLPSDKALGVSPWEGHCYPEAFRRLQTSYRQKYLVGQQQ
jgi:cephalosporin-C deacetylase